VVVALVLGTAALSRATTVPLVAPLVALGLLSLVVALLAARPIGITAAVLLLGAALFVGHEALPPAGPLALYAGGLLLLAELGFWSLERRTRVRAERGVDVRRWLALIAVVSASVAVALVVLLVGAEPRVQGTAVEAVGVAAAVGVAGLALLLLRNHLPASDG